MYLYIHIIIICMNNYIWWLLFYKVIAVVLKESIHPIHRPQHQLVWVIPPVRTIKVIQYIYRQIYTTICIFTIYVSMSIYTAPRPVINFIPSLTPYTTQNKEAIQSLRPKAVESGIVEGRLRYIYIYIYIYIYSIRYKCIFFYIISYNYIKQH